MWWTSQIIKDVPHLLTVNIDEPGVLTATAAQDNPVYVMVQVTVLQQ